MSVEPPPARKWEVWRRRRKYGTSSKKEKKREKEKKRKERRGEPICQHPIMPQSKLTIVKV
jgi:hypothetical protein